MVLALLVASVVLGGAPAGTVAAAAQPAPIGELAEPLGAAVASTTSVSVSTVTQTHRRPAASRARRQLRPISRAFPAHTVDVTSWRGHAPPLRRGPPILHC